MSDAPLLEQVVMGEIAGKNQAIHAYDKLMWTVRTGYLTLFSAGWGILLKAMFERECSAEGATDNRILLVMLLVTSVLGVGGFVVEHKYVRRKFRVIHALDELMNGIVASRGQVHDALDRISGSLRVSGDKDDETYRLVSGYAPEAVASRVIFLAPIVVAGFAVAILWK